MNYRKVAKLDLVVDLMPVDIFERYPEQESQTTKVNGVELSRIHIAERNPDAAAIIRMFLHSRDIQNYGTQIEI